MARRALSRDDLFELRWQRGLRDVTGPLRRLYGQRADLPGLLDRLRTLLRRHHDTRPAGLARLDLERDLNPDWFLSEDMVGYVFYIDRFAGRLAHLARHVPYLSDLGVTYAHMMPCLMPRPGDSDGGYAVMDYRRINPALGTMAEFQDAAMKFRAAGISPCIDLVLNHTAAEHAWAARARAGDPHYRDFYLTYPDREGPDAYEKTLLEIFPDQAPGNFTWDETMGRWVWTTFNSWQWDLNWANPEVFLAILDTLLFLAAKGVEVFRLDAVAFLWKRLGTTCQNLPEVHDILQALTQSARVAAPGVIFKAEAIVAPRDLVPYLGQGSHAGRVSNLAYHNSLMVQFWSALASGDTRLMEHVLATHFPGSFRRAGWATYIRCHDDIGWAVTEEDAAALGDMDGPGHRAFLADFYTGRFPMSFARGHDFQVNEDTGDRRTNGTFASLAGLEQALETGDAAALDLAVARILMGHALIAGFGGIPLIYMGDEIGLLNDHGHESDPARAADGRWMQRPAMDWDTVARLGDDSPASRLHAGVRHIMATRKATPQLATDVPTRVLRPGNPALFAVERPSDLGRLVMVVNVRAEPQAVTPRALGLDGPLVDRLDPSFAVQGGLIHLGPYAARWLLGAG